MAVALLALADAAHAQTYTYGCEIEVPMGGGTGTETHLLVVNEGKNLLRWRGKTYRIVQQPNCAKYGWHAEGHGSSFDFCTQTKGGAYIINSKGIPVASTSRFQAEDTFKTDADCSVFVKD
jgi:hypothetical protein